jgi:hypothetical protein
MKIILLVILFFIAVKLFAPGITQFCIEKAEKINPYGRIINAITTVESLNGRFLYNPIENSVGWFHIRQIRVTDYNQRTGSNITLQDCYDYEVSKTIFLYYACQYRPDEYEKISCEWNAGPNWKQIKSVKNYYKKVLFVIAN